MQIRPRCIIQRENISNSKPRLYRPDVIHIQPESRVPHQARIPRLILVQLRPSRYFKHRNQLLHAWNRQIVMFDRVAENQAIFQRLQPAVVSAAKELRISLDRLDGEVIADLQIVKIFGTTSVFLLTGEFVGMPTSMATPIELSIKPFWETY